MRPVGGAPDPDATPPLQEIAAVVAAATAVALRLGMRSPRVAAVAPAPAVPAGPSPWSLAGRLDAGSARRFVQRRP